MTVIFDTCGSGSYLQVWFIFANLLKAPKFRLQETKSLQRLQSCLKHMFMALWSPIANLVFVLQFTDYIHWSKIGRVLRLPGCSTHKWCMCTRPAEIFRCCWFQTPLNFLAEKERTCQILGHSEAIEVCHQANEVWHF